MGDGGHHLEYGYHVTISGVVVASSGPDKSFGAGTASVETACAGREESSVWCGVADTG